MKTKQIKVYSFKELKPEIQEQVLNQFREHNLDYEWWEYLYDEFEEELKEIGIDCKDFEWDLYRDKKVKMSNQKITDDNLFLNSFSNRNF